MSKKDKRRYISKAERAVIQQKKEHDDYHQLYVRIIMKLLKEYRFVVI